MASWSKCSPAAGSSAECSSSESLSRSLSSLSASGRFCWLTIPRCTSASQLQIQELRVLIKQADGALKEEAVLPVAFVPLTGDRAEGH